MNKYEKMCYHYNCKDDDIQDITDNLNKSKQKILLNVSNILKNIHNVKPNLTKKYQISGEYEYKILDELIKTIPNIKYSLVKDKIKKHNILTHMSGYRHSGCCDACDTKREYRYTKLPVMYIMITKLI